MPDTFTARTEYAEEGWIDAIHAVNRDEPTREKPLQAPHVMLAGALEFI